MDSVIACKLTEPEFRERRNGILRNVRAAVIEVKELQDGYAYRFPSDGAWIAELSSLITIERACCPFLRFKIDIAPGEGPIWLELSGPEGTKDFLNSIFA